MDGHWLQQSPLLKWTIQAETKMVDEGCHVEQFNVTFLGGAFHVVDVFLTNLDNSVESAIKTLLGRRIKLADEIDICVETQAVVDSLQEAMVKSSV